ncbi:regulator of G protein signaling superfamily [Dothidotthia symphoricarpi CBS 119687]|uniref:Regulator of G protein signaling superfamily n=1 Tax=Dothidotthia symphoricarpi CBS 119687 TaxID=1392245 RepID=A0A6A6A884_9PLEO|nr:regulator of G protein signaling superfamily [Dothidotthia symphoricarpi CBS 119687]KAF2128069.1 regulator of G protein signaling superfamily [Dothidotthia symphoricarpi CBS 119687]
MQPAQGSHESVDRKAWPTLFEVLSRKTVAPLDLFSFYIYMRDQQRSVDYLDFWLDVSQHLQLCRLYVRRLHRSLAEGTPDLEKNSRRMSYLTDAYRDNAGEGPSDEKDMSDQRLSQFLRSNMGSRNHSPQNSQDSNQIEDPPRPSFHAQDRMNDSSSPGQNSSTDNSQPRQEDLRASAEKILYTYLLPGSEREIIIPQSILNEVQEAIEGPAQRSDPELFDQAKDYVFQAMQRDAFPGFLQAKGFGNLVPQSMMLRLIVGLVSIFAAVWAAFILIFLGASRSRRCWLIIPFTIGIYSLFTHQYMLDPIIALLGYSEYTLFDFNKIKEKFVMTMLYRRSMSMLFFFLLVTTAVCCLFIFVPSKRL